MFQGGALYDGIGIIGATVMPHALFIGSSMAGVDRLDMIPKPPSSELKRSDSLENPRSSSWREYLNPSHYFRKSQSFRRPTPTSDTQTVELGNLNGPDKSDSGDHEEEKAGTPKSLDELGQTPEQESLRYEDELRRFDRIAWVDVHVMHASVSGSLGPGVCE